MRRLTLLLVIPVLAIAFWLHAEQQQQQSKLAPPPENAKKPVTNSYHGTKVIDNYQWLESNKSPEVKAWVAAQNQRARNYLDSLPMYAGVKQWLTDVIHSRSISYYEMLPAGGRLFAMKSQPGKQQDMLVELTSVDKTGSEHMVFDPNEIDKTGSTSVQFYTPSVDGRFVAVCLAKGGSESGSLHFYETETGKALADVIERVNFPTAGGSAAWNEDGTGVFYTRYPHEGERAPEDMNFYQQIYFHKMGKPVTQDSYQVGKDFPRIAEISLDSGDDGRFVLAIVQNGDGGQYLHLLRDPQGKWTKLTNFVDKISAAAFGADQALYFVSRKDAPRGKILRLPLTTPSMFGAKVVVPESENAIEGFRFALSGFPAHFAATKDRIYVVDVVGGPNQVRIFDHSGKQLGNMPIEPVSTVTQLVRLPNGEILFHNTSYTVPSAWYRYDAQQNRATVTALRTTSPVDFSDFEAVRETAVSKDGTKVPVTILYKKGLKKDGSHPTILTAYGGFSISTKPQFNPGSAAWLANGGVYAIANIRGGGEFGEDWHVNGMLLKKQNVFDDFIACSEHLIQAGYTSAKQLGIEGGSNGGLLMGAVLTQRPDLYRAVLSVAGLYDMMRFEATQNGQFNAAEYGSVKNLEQFKALLAYSPYQTVKAGTKYPAVLLTVGENDLRVDPWHSRKFAAALQSDSTSGLPILLLTYSNAGHGGIGSGEEMEIVMAADNYSWMFDQLGLPFQPVPVKTAK